MSYSINGNYDINFNLFVIEPVKRGKNKLLMPVKGHNGKLLQVIFDCPKRRQYMSIGSKAVFQVVIILNKNISIGLIFGQLISEDLIGIVIFLNPCQKGLSYLLISIVLSAVNSFNQFYQLPTDFHMHVRLFARILDESADGQIEVVL
eukprot:GHVR01065407.1.p1 GENE.GHVR01065407.1~~GHVR01065407.1.p1  ORF type:complete len:148 (-),score=0.09 GHVR01065407.1:1273-1716(-)